MKTSKILALSAIPAAFISSTAFAVDQSAITAAFTDGEAAVGAVATGVIGLAAIMTGVGLIYRWLAR